MESSKAGIGGYFEYIVRDKDGHVKQEGVMKNLVVNAGLAAVAGLLLNDVAGDDFDYLAVGTDSTAASASQTALLAEISDSGLARAASTGTRVTTTVTNDTAQLVHTWTVTGTKSIREMGVFNAASGGTMLARSTDTISVASGDSLSLTYRVKLESV